MPEENQVHGLTDSEFKFGYWYISNKEKIDKVFFIGAIVFVGILFLILFLMAGSYLTGKSKETKDFMKLKSFAYYGLTSWESKVTPVALEISEIGTLKPSLGQNDFYTEIANPNSNWLAVIDYRYSAGENVLVETTGFVYPGEKKPFPVMGVSTGAIAGQTVNFDIKKVVWWRLPNYANDFEERYRFEALNKNYKHSSDLGFSDLKKPISQLSFDVKNNSSYSYWQVPVLIALKSGSKTMAFEKNILESFVSGEKRSLVINLFGDSSYYDNFEIIFDVNVFDESNLMPVSVAFPDVKVNDNQTGIQEQ